MSKTKPAILVCLAFACCAGGAVFSVAQHGDIHAGYNQNGAATNHDAAIDFILSHTNDGTYNFVGYISTGDCWEQDANYTVGGAFYDADLWQFSDVTNAWHRMKTNGLFVWVCDGNHDADNPDTNSTPATATFRGCWDYNSTLLSWTNLVPISWWSEQTGYITNRSVYPVQQVAMTYTNSGIKLLWCNYDSSVTSGVDVATEVLPQTQWITNIAGQYPDHNLIVGAHFLISGCAEQSAGMGLGPVWPRLSPDDISGGPVRYYLHGINRSPWDTGLKSVPNLLACLSGHTRIMPKGHTSVIADDGHIVDVSVFNTQSSSYTPDPNGTCLNVLTFDSVARKVTFATLDIYQTNTLADYNTNFYSKPYSTSYYYRHNWELPLIHPRPGGRWRPR